MKGDLGSLLSLSKNDLLLKFNTSLQGLSISDAARQLKNVGYNQIEKTKTHWVFVESLRHSVNPLAAILLISACISGLTGNATSAFIIALMVILSILIDYIQSHRSLVAIQRLQEKIAATSTVIRNNQSQEILSKELVPGDIINFNAGDLIPADSILLSAKDLHVDQSTLTGESLPIEKEADFNQPIPQNIVSSPRVVFAGSSVVSGTAQAIVISTGSNSIFGQIAKNLSTRPPRTEFENGIIRFGLFITKTILFLVLFVFLISVFLKRDLMESLLFAIALAVGLTPEFLPMITTVTLAKGAVRMARQKVIVKNLAAIQNFGSIDILCSDKTGTLTTGKMILSKFLDLNTNPSQKTLLFAYLNSLLQTGIKSPINDAILEHVNINPLDRAILRHEHPEIQPYEKIDEIPFDFERRRSSIAVKKNGEQLLITKGAPESILKICTQYEIDDLIKPLDPATKEQYKNLYQNMSQEGYRLLTVAYRKDLKQPTYHAKDEQSMILLGFLVFTDPVLADSALSIQQLHEDGVAVKILTGDNELVATNICQQVGVDSKKIILGDELEKMTDTELAIQAENTFLFARISPNQKLRIITTLKGRGHVVGYIGDGINDAPSLHTADVGISVAGAADIAKDSSDIILLEKNLKVLHEGILEGRKSFGNIMKYLMMGTSSNFGNMFSMAGAILFLPFLPMLPMQILLNNLLYDISQITIPTDRVDKTFTQKPRHWDIEIIRRFMLYIGPISSIFDFLTFYVMIAVFSASAALFQTGWFVESLATQTLVIFVIRTAENPFKSRPSLALFLSVLLVVSIGTILPFSPLAPMLGFVPLPLPYFAFLIVATACYLLLVQIIKQKLMWKWIK